MSREPSDTGAQRSANWLQKGMETLTRMNRNPSSAPAAGHSNPLRDVFSDLIAYVLFFASSCEQQPPALHEFRQRITALINIQEERARTIGVTQEAFREARFAVLSWVDEMVLNSKWLYRSQWQHMMLTYYGTLNAGEEFFRRLDLLPSQANDVREIYFLCISLGFQGEFAFGDGVRELQALKQKLYKQLIATQGDIRQNFPRLFPEAYLKPTAAPQAAPQSNRLWYISAAAVPLLLFAVYWFLLNREANRILAALEMPVVSSKCDQKNWAAALTDDLRQKKLRAVDEPEGVRIIIESLVFAVSSAQLNPEADGKIRDIVNTVRCYAPTNVIVVEGHASKEGTGDEARNRKLSDDRARTVADAFIRAGSAREKVSAQGFGSSRPIALNDTEEGRSQNRRVEIIVKK
jgi:type VI secretion system protein ImpK